MKEAIVGLVLEGCQRLPYYFEERASPTGRYLAGFRCHCSCKQLFRYLAGFHCHCPCIQLSLATEYVLTMFQIIIVVRGILLRNLCVNLALGSALARAG